jgi:hypothetical protein
MAKRTNMTMPRVRLKEGVDPTNAIDRLYKARQLDRPKGSVRVSRDGVLSGSPTGFTDERHEPQRNQFPEDAHGSSYDDDTPKEGWPHDRLMPEYDRHPAGSQQGFGDNYRLRSDANSVRLGSKNGAGVVRGENHANEGTAKTLNRRFPGKKAR